MHDPDTNPLTPDDLTGQGDSALVHNRLFKTQVYPARENHLVIVL